MTPMRLEPVTTRSRVKHSTTEPLRSLTSAAYIQMQSRLMLLWMKRRGALIRLRKQSDKVSYCLQYMATILHEQMREQMAIVVNGGKMVLTVLIWLRTVFKGYQ